MLQHVLVCHVPFLLLRGTTPYYILCSTVDLPHVRIAVARTVGARALKVRGGGLAWGEATLSIDTLVD